MSASAESGGGGNGGGYGHAAGLLTTQRDLLANYLAEVGGGTGYAHTDPAWPSQPPDHSEPPPPVSIPPTRIPVTVHFGKNALHVVSGDTFRPCFWTGTRGNRRPGTSPEQTVEARRLGTLAVLTNVGHEFAAADLEGWLMAAKLPEEEFPRVGSAVRSWWRHRLRILGHELVVTSIAGRGTWRAQANPKMDFTFSEKPLGHEETGERYK